MPRYAFKLRITPDAIEEYDREHKRVWPELLELDRDPVNRRWQEFMSRLFEPVTETEPGELSRMTGFEWHRPPGV